MTDVNGYYLDGKTMTVEEREFTMKAQGRNIDERTIANLLYCQRMGVMNLKGIFDTIDPEKVAEEAERLIQTDPKYKEILDNRLTGGFHD